MTLSDGELEALRNLSSKKLGDTVGWVSIAAARGLTDLGFATRNRSGWQITDAGAAALRQQPQSGKGETTVVAFQLPRQQVRRAP